jgi:hypothetical protein
MSGSPAIIGRRQRPSLLSRPPSIVMTLVFSLP